jgi:hypothetical protein
MTSRKPAPVATAITPSDVSPVARAQLVDGDGLAAMQARFVADFADGAIGLDHNTYQHRTRVLRQLAEKLRRAAADGTPR